MSKQDYARPNWERFGAIRIGGSDRVVWRYDDADGRDVFQVTTGEEPSSNGGYHNLETLLKLKGVRISDVVTEVTTLKPR